MSQPAAPGAGPHPDPAPHLGRAAEPAPPAPDPSAAPDLTPVSSGHPAVDAAVRALAEVAGAAPDEQVPAFQAAHRTLRETLATIDEQ